MKNINIVLKLSIIIIAIVTSTTLVFALSTPYSLSGYVYDNDGTIPIVGANITFTNLNSSEVIYTNSGIGGQYQQDAANFPSGYYDADTIQYYTTYGTQNNTTTAPINVSNGGTSLNIVLSVDTSTPSTSDVGIAINNLSSILIFLVLLIIDFAIVLYVFTEIKTAFYSDAGIPISAVVFSFLGFTLSFILASHSLAAPIEMPELNYFLLSIAIVMLIVLVRCVIGIVANAIQALEERKY